MSTPLASDKMSVGANWRYSSGVLHAAADYSVGMNTPVFAVRNGTILDLHDGEKDHPADGKEHGDGEPGNWILLGTTYKDRPASVLYLHLTAGLMVEKNKPVVAGQQIARSGNSGHTFGPHLHVAAMFGATEHVGGRGRFHYLDGIPSSEPAPTGGVASNGITIYPPGQLYSRPGPSPFGTGKVFVDRLRLGVTDSDSVRRLQTLLNRLRLDGVPKVQVTGTYDAATRDRVMQWQIQRDGKEPGTDLASGQLNLAQARRLFPDRYVVRASA
ncbi:MAG TPA: peptidoglycan DD-metalloendopeptidase family protein [Nocardioidaceae bacterium]|nr:peptidoglycan DD-metalloendopeptidase family protein [Nocardioidaceae bacterium]